jgi:hypothetical protein
MRAPRYPTPLFTAVACVFAACRSEPTIDQTAAVPQHSKVPASTAPPPIAVSSARERDAPAVSEFSALTGMWHGRMTYNTSPTPPGLGDDNGIRGRAVSARIDDDGSVSLAIQQFTVGVGFAQTGASSRCTIEGAIENRTGKLNFVERASACKGHFALARRTGLDLLSPCLLRFTDLDKPAGAGALFTLNRQGCRAGGER